MYAPQDARRILAGAGIRDEFVFPTPLVLRTGPTLLGYYRLLLGRPMAKSFYGSDGFGMFRSMETAGVVRKPQADALGLLCTALGKSLGELVREMTPKMSIEDVRELTLITLGSQFQGANNNRIGATATSQVWLAIQELVPAGSFIERTSSGAIVRNSSGRSVSLVLASDPDVRIQEELAPGRAQPKVAIEIKGGTDKSNAYNRAGEAEKSHVKARRLGFQHCWTVIAMRGIDRRRLQLDSPSTTAWFDIGELLAREGDSWADFKDQIAIALGIPLLRGVADSHLE